MPQFLATKTWNALPSEVVFASHTKFVKEKMWCAECKQNFTTKGHAIILEYMSLSVFLNDTPCCALPCVNTHGNTEFAFFHNPELLVQWKTQSMAWVYLQIKELGLKKSQMKCAFNY